MKKFFEGEKFLANGREKDVFVVPKSSDRPAEVVISHFKENKEGTDREAKARYYLTKILHYLFPENIPDVYFSSKKTLITEKVDTGRLHQRFHELKAKGEKNEETAVEWQECKGLAESMADMARNRVYGSSFNNDLLDLGVSFDFAFGNFGVDDKNNIKYVDSFDPWSLDPKNELCRGYNLEKLTKVIESLPNDRGGILNANFSSRRKERAKRYLVELEKLFIEEAEGRKNSSAGIK